MTYCDICTAWITGQSFNTSGLDDQGRARNWSTCGACHERYDNSDMDLDSRVAYVPNR